VTGKTSSSDAAEQPERQFDLRPVMAKLAAGDVNELVQHLSADDTAAAQAIHRPLFLASEVAV